MALSREQLVNLKVGQQVVTAHVAARPGRVTRIYVPADGQRVVWVDYGSCLMIVAPSQIIELVR